MNGLPRILKQTLSCTAIAFFSFINISDAVATVCSVSPQVLDSSAVLNAPSYFTSVTSVSSSVHCGTFFGVAGSARCLPIVATPSAVETDVISGARFWNEGGEAKTGTFPNRGSVDLTQSFSAGKISSVTGISASDVCSSAQFNGSAGTAVCASFPSISSSASLSWGSTGIASSKNIEFTVTGSGVGLVNLAFSGDTSFFQVSAIGVATTAIIPSASVTQTLASAGSAASKIFSLKPVFTGLSTGDSKSMTITITDALGNLVGTHLASFSYSHPMLLGSLLAWFRADSITGVSNGGAIATWPDYVDGTRLFTQSTAGSRPTLTTNALNSLPVVTIEEKTMTSNIAMPSGSEARTTFTVLRGGSGIGWNADRAVWYWGTTSAGNSYGLAANAGQPGRGWFLSLWGTFIASGNAFGSTYQLVTTHYDGTTHSMFINGTASLNGSSTQTLTTGTSLTLQLGNAYSGDLAELAIYGTALSTVEREVIECNIWNRWLPPGSLGHSCP